MGVWRDKKEFDELAETQTHAEKEGSLISITDALKTIKAHGRKAIRHKWEYSALVYAAEMKRHIFERSAAPGRVVYAVETAQRQASEGKAASAAKTLSEQSKKLVALAGQEKRMAAATEKYWNKWRYPDDPMKTNPFQNTLNAIKTSDGYLRALAQRLDKAAGELSAGKTPEWEGLLAE